jgi:hypothetical protein
LRGFALRSKSRPAVFLLTCCVAGLVAGPAFGSPSGGSQVPAPVPDEAPGAPPVATTPLAVAQLSPDGRTAVAPASAPPVVQATIDAANQITGKPYRYGGGHGTFRDSAYDCSGSVSYALAAAGLVSSPMVSGAYENWGDAGPGQWVTLYANADHIWMEVAGWRFDTVALAEGGTRWSRSMTDTSGYVVRHPPGL